MTAISLRPYQTDAVTRLRASYRNGNRAPLFQLPTGGGKTFVFSYVGNGAAGKGRRVLILVHRKELLTQASMSLARIGLKHTLIAQDKHVREAIGIHVNELSDTFIDLAAPVAIASVDTIIRRLSMTRPPDLIICDEAHHLTRGNKWGKVVEAYPNAHILGVTATPVRTDGKGLGVDCDGFFDDLVCGPTMRELIDMGFLLAPTVYAPPAVLDLTGVRTQGGDYAQKDLAAAMDKPTITGDAVKHYANICPKVPAIAFCVSIDHAKHVAAEFRAAGFDFRAIDGTMHDAERRGLINGLARGTIDGLTSCDIISEGTDIPVVGCGILLRPTKSEGLYLQQVGRVLRPSPGQSKAFILDHVGNCLIHGLPDADREWSLDGRKKKSRAANDNEPRFAVMQCPQCYTAHEPAPACPNCGHEYEVSGREGLKQVEGELAEVTGEAAEILRRTQRREIGRAKSLEELKAIAEQRGYKPKWAEHVWKARQRRAAF